MKWKSIKKSKSKKPRSKERYVAIDLGTKCGVAVNDDGCIIVDCWDFKTKRTQGSGMKYLKFKAALEDLLATGKITALFYEEVRRHKGVAAAHTYGGFESHLLAFCDTNNIPYTSIPVGTIKRRATGSGNASKDKMIKAAQTSFPSLNIGDKEDNKADAVWILTVGLEDINRG